MDCKQQIIDAGKAMYNAQLTVGTWGNISIRDPESNLIYLTPSGMDYASCTTGDVVVFTLDDKLVEGFRRPTIEKSMHLAILRARPDVNVVLHTHPLYASVFAALHEDIPAISEEFAACIGRLAPCCKNYCLPGTDALAQEAAATLGDGAAILLPNHGALTAAPDLATAFKISNILEKTAHILYMSRAIGTPIPLSDADADAIHNFSHTAYGQR